MSVENKREKREHLLDIIEFLEAARGMLWNFDKEMTDEKDAGFQSAIDCLLGMRNSPQYDAVNEIFEEIRKSY